MRSPTHLHSTSSLLLGTVLLLLVCVGVVHGQQPDAQAPIDPQVVARVTGLMQTPAPVAPTTTTTAPPPPPTTTTVPVTVPPITTTTPPAPRPVVARPTTTTVAAPAPAPAVDGPTYAMSIVNEVIPANWLAVVPVRVLVIAGKTSWSSWGGLIQIGDWHLYSSVARARNTLTHEWGHQVAWRFGTDVYNGAPPAGFPYNGAIGEEMWADCVAEALTGTSYPTSGLPRCSSAALSFTHSFFAAGPGHPLR